MLAETIAMGATDGSGVHAAADPARGAAPTCPPPRAPQTREPDRDLPIGFDDAAEIVRGWARELTDPPTSLAIFGSVARGCNGLRSDIDTLAIGAGPYVTKMNLVRAGHRLQIVEGSVAAWRKKVAAASAAGNSFAIEAVTEARFIAGDESQLRRLQQAAAPLLAIKPPPLTQERYLSTRCRCADALEKIEAVADPDHRCQMAIRCFSLLQDLSAAAAEEWPRLGGAAYPQFVRLAPGFAPALSGALRSAIAADDYRQFAQLVVAFFERAGGYSWECREKLRI